MSDGESRITDWFAAQAMLNSEDFPIGIGDDMAQIRVGGDGTVLITTDMLLEGSHFELEKATIEQVGYKSMAVSLSDCAAMATMPLAAVVSVGLPKGSDPDLLKKLHAGIVRAGDMFNCMLVGGDITSWPSSHGKLVVNVTMLSRTAGHKPIRRTTAREDDVICVTGSLGGSLAGRHLDFVPRVNEAITLAGMVEINSMMDISDGLSTDLNHLCRLSGLGALVLADRIPISETARKTASPLASALNDGEDFELLFTLSRDEYEKLAAGWKGQVPITRIGLMTPGDSARIQLAEGHQEPLIAGGYDHLKF